MPSKLLTTSLSYLGSGTAARAKLVGAAQALSRLKSLMVRGPWGGLQPDIDPNLTDGTVFNHLTNVLARGHGDDHGEVLGLPDGFRQIDAAHLPLEDDTAGAPVVAIDQLDRVTPIGAGANEGEHDGEFISTPLAVTAIAPGSTNAKMYRIAATGVWTEVPPSAAVSTAKLTANRDGRVPSPSMPDYCSAPFGAVARTHNTAGGDNKQSGPISEPCWIFTNDVDPVMVFPSSSSETLLGTHAYEPLCDAVSSPNLAPFLAKSCETWNGRVYFGNTSEAGVRHNQRVRRTAKFTADPKSSTAGAGFYDFREFQGDLLRIHQLGDVLGVYFTDGVAFMRATGVPTSPDEPQIIETTRGLLGTHCLCAIGRNVHFGVFTDGWWLLDQSGRWQEVGLLQAGNQNIPKWRQTFYEDLPSDFRHRIFCYYDQPTNLVYIAKPTRSRPEPEEVWIYDPVNDRVFMENYPVVCFGTMTPVAQPGVTIDALPGTIDSLAGTIDSYGAVAGFPKSRCHGDLLGYVFEHSRELVGFDSSTTPAVVQDPAWLWSLGVRSLGDFRKLQTIDVVSVEYFNRGNANAVSVEVYDRSGTPTGLQTRSVLMNQGALEDVRTANAWFRFTSSSVGLRLSSSGEFHHRAAAVDYWGDDLEPRGQG